MGKVIKNMSSLDIEEPKNNILLIKGDGIEITKVLVKELGKGFADCIITDPPYGCTLGDNINEFNKDIPCLKSDDLWGAVWDSVKEDGAVLMFNEGIGYLRMCYGGMSYFRYNYAIDFLKKRGHLNCNRMPMLRHGLVGVFYKKIPNYHPPRNFNDEKGKASDILFVKNQVKQIYPHERDVELLKYFLQTYTDENDLVYDFCMGAGSLAQACFETNRKFIGVELIEDTYQKAVQRIKNL